MGKIKSEKENFNPIETKGFTMEQIMEKLCDHKVSFAKVSWGKLGPYILSFPDSTTKDYCEMNAHEFKSINVKEIKTATVPIWECGAKTPEQINKLPKLDVKKFMEKDSKDKLKRKEEKAEKLSKALKKAHAAKKVNLKK